jgi:uncharacterized membrane protein
LYIEISFVFKKEKFEKILNLFKLRLLNYNNTLIFFIFKILTFSSFIKLTHFLSKNIVTLLIYLIENSKKRLDIYKGA